MFHFSFDWLAHFKIYEDQNKWLQCMGKQCSSNLCGNTA